MAIHHVLPFNGRAGRFSARATRCCCPHWSGDARAVGGFLSLQRADRVRQRHLDLLATRAFTPKHRAPLNDRRDDSLQLAVPPICIVGGQG